MNILTKDHLLYSLLILKQKSSVSLCSPVVESSFVPRPCLEHSSHAVLFLSVQLCPYQLNVQLFITLKRNKAMYAGLMPV